VKAEEILGFSQTLLQARYDEPKPTPAFHLELWRYCCDDAAQVAIAAPRGHAKSTAITLAYALAAALFREHSHILVLSANEELASAFLTEIKGELRDNELIHSAFGEPHFTTDKETECVVKMGDGHKFRFIAKGAGQRMRGLKWNQRRPDLVLCDDLEDDQVVVTQESREKFRRWFYGAVRPIVRNGGKIRLYGTVIHMDSLLERTMPDPANPLTATEGLKTVSKNAKKGWKAVKFKAHNEDFTRILWPSQFPVEKLKAIRHEYAEMGLLDVYGQEYLNDPIDESTAFFQKRDLLPMSESDKDRKKRFYVGCDLAISEKKKSAYTCFVIGGVDPDKTLHVVDVRRGHWDSVAIVQEMWAINERYGQPLFRFEEENIARTLLPVIEHENMVRAKPILFDSKTPSKDKVARARAFQYRTRAGNVRFDKSADWYADYEQELTKFPKWRTADQVDASSWLGDLIAEESEADTAIEEAEDAYDTLLETDYSLGRSLMTGY